MIKAAALGIAIAFFIEAFLLWKFWPLAVLFVFMLAIGRASAARARR